MLKDKDSYSDKKDFPQICLYVLYTGNRKDFPRTQKLSDLIGDTDIDITVHFICGSDFEDGPVYEYASFVDIFTKNLIGSSCYKETIEKTIRECEEKGILTEFIAENRGKLMDLLEDRYLNPEKLCAQETYNYRMEGKEEGISEGRNERTAEIAERLIQLDVPIETICASTDLSEEEVLRLKEKLS